jgi:hypothetical protein
LNPAAEKHQIAYSMSKYAHQLFVESSNFFIYTIAIRTNAISEKTEGFSPRNRKKYIIVSSSESSRFSWSVKLPITRENKTISL